MPKSYTFNSVQTHLNMKDGHVEEVTEAVSVRNGKGTKSVRIRRNNTVKVAKHPLTPTELKNIQTKTFMPNLFQPCHADCKKTPQASKTPKANVRKGKTLKKKPTKK